MMQNKGFTLVELAIVLVIIGLIVGAVVTGSDMLGKAQLNGVISDIQNYTSSTKNFRERYGSLPGDMPDASNFWTGATNGNGNGQVGRWGVVAEYPERFAFWQHLAKAGFIRGDYTGVAAASGADDADIGVNVPESSVDGVGYYAAYRDRSTNHGWFWHRETVTFLTVGTFDSSGAMSAGGFSTQDAEFIDRKMDDGVPGYGAIQSRKDLADCTTSTTDPDVADYDFTDTDDNSCAFIVEIDK